MSTAIGEKRLSTKPAEQDARQRARQSKAHPDCRSTTIKSRVTKISLALIVGPRQSSSRRDRRNGHPDCRCVLIQIVALQRPLRAPQDGAVWAGTDPQTQQRPPERNGRTAMRYLKLAILILAYALISPAFAQTCCPAGCAPEANRCVTTGPLWTRCIPIACAGGSRRPSAGSSGPTSEHRKSAVPARPLRTARTYVAPRQIPPHCPLMNPTKAQVDEATNQCVNALTGSAQLRGCFFENDADRAEDKRTGLSCPDRQAALAKQCRKRC